MHVQECGNGDTAGGDPSEDARGLSVPRERQQHARARVEAGVGRRQHGGEQDSVDDVRGRSETGALEHHGER